MARKTTGQKIETPDTTTRRNRKWETVLSDWNDAQRAGTHTLPTWIKNRAIQSLSGLNVPAFADQCREMPDCQYLTHNAIIEAVSSEEKNNHLGNKAFLTFAQTRWQPHLANLEVGDYEALRFTGPQAVEDFKAFLKRHPDRLETLPKPSWDKLPGGLPTLASRIEEFLSDSNSKLMTVSSTTSGGFFACSAQFNAYFLRKLQREVDDSLPIFYASVGRPGGPILINEADDVREPDETVPHKASSLGVWRRRLDLPTLVFDLLSFLEGPKHSNKPAVNSLDLWDGILKIRKLLASRPALLVFDAYSAMGGYLPTLRSTLTGDPLSVLLPHLLEDWPAIGDDEKMPTSDKRSKILVFSDQPPAEFQRFDPREESWPGRISGSIIETAFRDLIIAQTSNGKGETLPPAISSRQPTASTSSVTNEDIWALIYTHLSLGNTDADIDHRSVGESVRRFTDYLSQAGRGDALLILMLTALSPGGLRYVTLWNIIRQWDKAEDYSTAQGPQAARQKGKQYQLAAPKVDDKPAIRLKKVMAIARQLRPLLVEVRDDKISGLDDTFRKWEYLDPPSKPGEMLHTRLRLVDIRSRILREQIVGVIGSQLSELQLSRLHRLLAEELLRQHTVALRHRVTSDPLPLDALRAISQFLFHGWHSLAPGLDAYDPGLKPIARHLPVDPKKAYVRLYSTFFQQLTAGALHGEFTARIAPVENLQIDLLKVAMNLDRLKSREGAAFSYTRRSNELVGTPAFLDSSKPEERRLLLDQLTTYGRLALHQNRFTELDKIMDLAGGLLVMSEDGTLLSQRHRVEYLRLQSRRLQTADTSELFTSIQSEFETANSIEDAIKAVVDATLAAKPFNNRDRILEEVSRQEADRLCEGADSPEVYIHRADLVAVYADLLWVHEEVNPLSDETGLKDLLRSFTGFRIAEHIRRIAFDAYPGRTMATGDAHHVRSFVRVALRLAGQIRKLLPVGDTSYPSVDYFVREARRQNDMQTLFYGISHSDRASIHMLEAHFYRFDATRQPELAASALLEAERWMLPSIDRPRARKRLIFERVRVASATAQMSLTAGSQAANELDRSASLQRANKLLKIAERDLALLETQIADQYWDKMRASSSDKLENLRKIISDA